MDLQQLLEKWSIKCDINTILSMWNESHRSYHNLNHLNDLISQINENKSKFSEKEYEKLMLADFRNEPKYIQNKWVQTTQMFHDKIVRMEFQLESTDNGTFGMNTPGYFCLGDFRFMIETLEKTETKKMEIYPNPSSTFINTDIQSPKSFEIIDMTGRQFMLMESPQSNKIDISQLPQGIYYLKVKANEKVYSSRFVKL